MRRSCDVYGFSLVELVVVIALTGIVAGFAMSFIGQSMRAYGDIDGRARLVAHAETALQRMARDVRRALPNSIRVAGGATALELLYTLDGARYRSAPGVNTPDDHTAASDVLDPGPDASFNVLGRLRALSFSYGTALPSGQRIAIYSTGSAIWSDAAAGTSPGAITPASTTVTIQNDGDEDQLVLGSSFDFIRRSPRRRLYVVEGPVSFLCDTTAQTLTRYSGYAPTASQPTNPLAAPIATAQAATLASGVASCQFSYAPGSSQRASLVTLALTLARDGSQVRLLEQVHVVNAP
ncbi:MAG: type II secretion system protein J [Myxococcota bacterium]